MEKTKGRITIPTDLDMVKETQNIMDEWGADAMILLPRSVHTAVWQQ